MLAFWRFFLYVLVFLNDRKCASKVERYYFCCMYSRDKLKVRFLFNIVPRRYEIDKLILMTNFLQFFFLSHFVAITSSKNCFFSSKARFLLFLNKIAPIFSSLCVRSRQRSNSGNHHIETGEVKIGRNKFYLKWPIFKVMLAFPLVN